MQFPSIYLKVKELSTVYCSQCYLWVEQNTDCKNPLHPEDKPGLVQQRAKKVMSNNPGLVGFVGGNMNSVLRNRQVKFSRGVQITEKL